MDIFDCHTHIYPAAVSAKAVESVGKFYNIPMDADGTPETLLRLEEAAGVTREVVCSVAVLPKHVRNINNFIASQCALHPGFVGLGTLHAADENLMDELENIVSLGLHGVKIHPDTQLFNLDDERMLPVYDFLQDRGLPILIHCGDYRYDYSHPRRLARILDLFPRLRAVGAHFGGWSVPDLALEYLEHKNCWVDTSSSMAFTGGRRAAELIRAYGAERVLFGTDFPMWQPADELAVFRSLGLTETEQETILSLNPKAAFNVE